MQTTVNVYHIQIHGQVDVQELNHLSPHQMTPIEAGVNTTRVTVRTDQTGLIGILRYLNDRGFIFRDVCCGEFIITT